MILRSYCFGVAQRSYQGREFDIRLIANVISKRVAAHAIYVALPADG